MVHSASPSRIATVGGTTVTLLGANLCRHDVSVAIERSRSTILHISSSTIVLQTPAGLNYRPSLNLSYSSLWCVVFAFVQQFAIEFDFFILQA
jgi:hypothetical protein